MIYYAMQSDIKKILLIRLSAVGDTIHTLPFANALKRNIPSAKLYWVVEDKASFFVKQAKCVDNVIEIPRKKWNKDGNIFKNLLEFIGIIKELRKEKYDIAIDVQQLLKSGIILGLSGAKRKLSMDIAREGANLFANEIVKSKHKLFDPDYHVTKRYGEFLEYLGIKDDEISFNLKDFSEKTIDYVNKLLLNTDENKPKIVFAPATTWNNKHWAVENWRQLYNHFKDKANIIFTGTDSDEKLVKSIIKGQAENYTNLCGKTDLEHLSQVLKVADLVISPDSGTAHIAWAVEHPSVITIFTATAKNRTAPLGKNCYSFASDLHCSPCLKRKCKQTQNFEACTKAISPDVIIKKAEEILKQSGLI